MYHNPNYVGFSQLQHMITALDRIQRSYHSSKRFPLWNTEFGYITNPPTAAEHYLSPVTAAYYDNWAEYLSWKNPRIASSMQYLLYDPNPSVGTPECGGFAAACSTRRRLPPPPAAVRSCPGSQSRATTPYRLPIYLPRTTAGANRPLKVWGCVRPADFALLDTFQPQTAQIQFQAGSVGPWLTVATVSFRHPTGSCYFTKSIRLPKSGSVRLAWAYPPEDTNLAPSLVDTVTDALAPAVSRTVAVTIR